MYISTLVDDVQKVVEELRTEHGDFVLAMLYARNESADSGWNLIVSAQWTDHIETADATRLVIQALSAGLDSENKRSISRVTVLPTTDPFVREIVSYYQVASPGAGQWIRNVSADGVPIGNGFLFYSQQK
jgi:hypothetical protein